MTFEIKNRSLSIHIYIYLGIGNTPDDSFTDFNYPNVFHFNLRIYFLIKFFENVSLQIQLYNLIQNQICLLSRTFKIFVK